MRPPGGRLRYAAHPHDAAQSSRLCHHDGEGGVQEGEGPAGLRKYDDPASRADHAGGRGRREAQGDHAPRVQHEALQRRSGDHQEALQRGLGEELGLRPDDRRRDRPPGETAEAGGGTRPHLLCRARGEGHRLRRGAPRLERRPEEESLGRPVPRHPQDPLGSPENFPHPHPAPRRARGIPRHGRRCPHVSLDLDQGNRQGLQLGRRWLDPGRQSRHEQRPAPPRVPRLQDLPDLRSQAVNAFVTGGTGFVGAHLVQALRARGDRVTALVRSPAKAQALGWTDVRIVRGDLHDRAALADGCADADVVYHVAGLIAARNYTGFVAANRDGTRRVQEAAEGAPRRPRLVLVSSQAVGGPNPRGMPTDESVPPAPVTDYGRSKLAAEDVVRSGKGPWAIVRPPVVYGERDTETLKLFRLAKLGLGAVFGDGGQELSVIYAGDLAQALIAAGTHPAALGGTYYACHPEVHTSRSLVLAIGRAG